MNDIEKEKHLKMCENIQRDLDLRGIIIPRIDPKNEDYSDMSLYEHNPTKNK